MNTSRRKWRHYSCRSLMLLMLAAAFFAAGWRAGQESARNEQPNVVFSDFDLDGDVDLYIGASAGSTADVAGNGFFQGGSPGDQDRGRTD